jgi:uncharacterized membrane protein (DUF373 family)
MGPRAAGPLGTAPASAQRAGPPPRNTHCETATRQSHWIATADDSDLLPNNKGRWPMPDLRLQRDWKRFLSYELFEQIASRIVMLFIAIIIVYTLILMGMTLFDQIKFSPAYIDTESLRDVFGSILSILILIEFNHSIALAISRRAGILQARPIILITILVIARKVILLDFTTATFEQMIGIGAIALAFGLLFWLINARPANLSESQPDD